MGNHISLSCCNCSFTQTPFCLGAFSASDAFFNPYNRGQATSATSCQQSQFLYANPKDGKISSKLCSGHLHVNVVDPTPPIPHI